MFARRSIGLALCYGGSVAPRSLDDSEEFWHEYTTSLQWLNIACDRLRDCFVATAFRQTKKQYKKDNKQRRYSDSRRQGACTLRMAFGVAICCFLVTFSANPQTSHEDLRKIAQNPFADVIKLPIEEDVYSGTGPFSRNASALQIQPVFPVRISEDWLLIPRVVATGMAYQPDTERTSGGVMGMGDITPTFFFAPANDKKIIWGAGPSLLMPTATSAALGSGKWALGPSLVVFTQPHWGFLGVLVQNTWSFAGDSKRAPVNEMLFQYSFSYNLPRGWYLTTSPTISADWTQAKADRWVVPFGGGVGRTFNLGKQAIDANASIFKNAIRPENQTFPKWQLSLQVILLFPEK